MWAFACANVTLPTQHAVGMRRIILSTIGSLTPSNISTLSHKQHDFREKNYGTKCMFFLYNAYLKYLSLQEEFSQILSQM
jgi:hypothetical protein